MAAITNRIKNILTLAVGGDRKAVTDLTDEIDLVGSVTAGTQAASKAIVNDSNANQGIAKMTQLHIGTSGSETQVNATGAELNQACDQSAQMIAAGATLTIDATHHNTVVLLDQASGSVITLPASSGSGLRVKFIVSVTVTSNLHSINCAGTDEYAGVIYQVDTDTSDAIAAYPALAADNFDAIDMDGSTKGGLIGDWIEIQDVVTGTWALTGWTNCTGTPASPLSAT